MRIYPNNNDNINSYNKTKNIDEKIFGQRFHRDQSLYEYLIEFLLIFCSYKDENCIDSNSKFRFHEHHENLDYYAETMMGLRRFIFLEGAKKDTIIPYDEEALELLKNALKDKMEFEDQNSEKTIQAIQDLLRGYAVVLKKRSWCAQQILPICPELIFCEASPNVKKRKLIDKSAEAQKIDTEFDFKQRNFLSRGGELYYLHILQVLNEDMDRNRRDKLNNLLRILMTTQSMGISKISRFVQDTWYSEVLGREKRLSVNYSISFIPEDAYKDCGNKTVDELINYLGSDFQQIKKIEVLAKGIMFQIMRMMYSAVCRKLDIEKKPWIIDMTNNTSKETKKIASKAYAAIDSDFKLCLSEQALEMGFQGDDLNKNLKKGTTNSLSIFKSKGKELRCIIPMNGKNERFTLSEDLLRFLVLALVEPEDKVTFDMFLDRLYDHFGIVIGSKQYEKVYELLDEDQLNIKNSLNVNQKCFQDYLKSTGFLKELSDSTSLVINPYSAIE